MTISNVVLASIIDIDITPEIFFDATGVDIKVTEKCEALECTEDGYTIEINGEDYLLIDVDSDYLWSCGEVLKSFTLELI